MQIAQVMAATALAAPTCCAVRWARRSPRRWPRNARSSSKAPRPPTTSRHQGRRGVRPSRKIRQLRLQQIPRRRLCRGQLPDRLSEGELPGRIHGGCDELRYPPDRQAGRLQARGGQAGPENRGPLRQRQPCHLHRPRRRHRLWPWRAEERRRRCDAGPPGRPDRRARPHPGDGGETLRHPLRRRPPGGPETHRQAPAGNARPRRGLRPA
jgi:hypothetical protein